VEKERMAEKQLTFGKFPAKQAFFPEFTDLLFLHEVKPSP
jgi:hypothetical protein